MTATLSPPPRLLDRDAAQNSNPLCWEPAPICTGEANGHAGEPLQGAVSDSDGIHRLLITLSAPRFRAYASIELAPTGGIQVEPSDRSKSRAAAELTADALDAPGLNAILRIESNIPARRGCGSSTAECEASVRATARLLRARLTAEEIARLVWRAEHATDSTMFGERPVAFCHREGTVYEYLPGRFPAMFAIVVDTEPEGLGVDTLKLEPAGYQTSHLQHFRAMLGLMRHAFRSADARSFGRVSTLSATINQEFLPKRLFAEILSLGNESDAYGVVAAHSGTVLTLLYPTRFSGSIEHQAVRRRLTILGLATLAEFCTVSDSFQEVAA